MLSRAEKIRFLLRHGMPGEELAVELGVSKKNLASLAHGSRKALPSQGRAQLDELYRAAVHRVVRAVRQPGQADH